MIPLESPCAGITLSDVLRRHARVRPANIAFVDSQRRCTFSEMDDRVTRLANALSARGIERGDRVAVLGYNSIELIESWFAALRLARGVSRLRQADVMATLGVVLAYAGRTAEGLRQFDAAKDLTAPADLPRLLLRRAHVLALVGREREAHADLTQAIMGSRALGDQLWEARALNNRVVVSIALLTFLFSRVDLAALWAGAR